MPAGNDRAFVSVSIQLKLHSMMFCKLCDCQINCFVIDLTCNRVSSYSYSFTYVRILIAIIIKIYYNNKMKYNGTMGDMTD